MSRLFLFVLIIAPVLCRGGGRGGGRSGGGHYSHASHATHTGYNHGNSHSYPASTGLSGHGTGGNRPASGAAYPPSNGLSGNNRAPGNTYHKTEIHHHYAPPQQIHYGGSYSYPVYHGSPPTYVYTYRDSGSSYNTLLTGLALYNLGRMSSHSHNHEYREYRQRDGEVCMFEIHKPNGEYQQTRIGCELMSHFIWERESQQSQHNNVVSTNTNTVTTVTETKTSDNTTVITNTTKIVDALEVKGPPIQVTSGMSCFMIRTLRGYSTIKEKVDCGLLQAYAVNSFNNAWLMKPVLTLIILLSSMLRFV